MEKTDLLVELLIKKFKDNYRRTFDMRNVIKRLKYYKELGKFSMNELDNEQKKTIYIRFLKLVKEELQEWIINIEKYIDKMEGEHGKK